MTKCLIDGGEMGYQKEERKLANFKIGGIFDV